MIHSFGEKFDLNYYNIIYFINLSSVIFNYLPDNFHIDR